MFQFNAIELVIILIGLDRIITETFINLVFSFELKLLTNCRPLRVSTLARNLLRFLLAFTILISIAAPSNGMLPIQVSSHSKVLPFFCFARLAKCVLPVPGIKPSPQDPKARIITTRPTGQAFFLLNKLWKS